MALQIKRKLFLLCTDILWQAFTVSCKFSLTQQ